MPVLYLFTVQNLNSYPDDRNFAIISREIQIKLEELVEGDTTNIFYNSGVEKDIIKYKLAVPFLNSIYDDILVKYKNPINMPGRLYFYII